MNCMSCVHNIEDALKETDSSIDAKADVKNKTLTVDSKLPAESIKKIIEDAGYPVASVTQG